MKTRAINRLGMLGIGALIQLTISAPAMAEEWVSIGPFGVPVPNKEVVSGQTNALAVHPTDANTVFVGTAEGGLWRTRDGGATWTPLTDFLNTRPVPASGGGTVSLATLSVGAVAIDPVNPDVVYVGTGDPNPACCPLTGPGLGVFRSTTGGDTWTSIGSINRAGCAADNRVMSGRTVFKLVVRPESGGASRVFAATDFGIFKYTESTDCWQSLTDGLPTFGIRTASDLVMDSSGTLYAASWSRGLFKTTDAPGTKWTQLTSPVLPTSGVGRIALAIGSDDVLYAGFEIIAEFPQYGLFTSHDAGGSWVSLPNPPNNGGDWFKNALGVDPTNSDIVYVGQQSLWRATDGGRKGGTNNYDVSPPITGFSWTTISCCAFHKNPVRNGADVHGDFHAIVFAPPPSLTGLGVAGILYVAQDGGVSKGVVDAARNVTWQQATQGLAISQCGSIGLSPSNANAVTCGFWHSGNAFSNNGGATWYPYGGGDGKVTTIDAASSAKVPATAYFSCNAFNSAGGEGAICRAKINLGSSIPLIDDNRSIPIWSDNNTLTHWSDPYRPGQLLRVNMAQNAAGTVANPGILFRTSGAATMTAKNLDIASAWTAVDPPGKTGNTTALAFKRKVSVDELPTYFIGTDTGQIWQGSPEVPWVKLCECLTIVRNLAADANDPNRIVAIFTGTTSPGRVKELVRQPSGTWTVSNMDAAFNPSLQINSVLSVAIDPLDSNTVFIGTDLGLYRGRFEGGSWSWVRPLGVPNVQVVDIQAHQQFSPSVTGVVRAATYGRGVFELQRDAFAPIHGIPNVTAPDVSVNVVLVKTTLAVQAVAMKEDGALRSLDVKINVTPADDPSAISTRMAPFELKVPNSTYVILTAPQRVPDDDEIWRFAGWAVNGNPALAHGRAALVPVFGTTHALAYYERKKRIADPAAGPLALSASASAPRVCVSQLSHELTVSWAVSDGQRPAHVQIEIKTSILPAQIFGVKPLKGSKTFPVSLPDGGFVQITVKATDWKNGRSSQASSFSVGGCEIIVDGGGPQAQ